MASGDGTPAIELRDLTKDYGRVRALDSVSLTAQAGETVGFLGPNGAGKTTAIRILFDLIRPTSGSVSVFGFDCQAQSRSARRRMGYLSGDLDLYDDLTGRQTIDFISTLREHPPDAGFVDYLVDSLDLDTGRIVREYSKGNRQKLGLVLAMMSRPDLLVLDEPTSGLDPLGQDTVAGLLADLARNGSCVFFSSHILPEVERMCDRVAILRGGKLVAVEDVGNLKGRSLHMLEVTFDAPVNADDFKVDGVEVTQQQPDVIHIKVQDNLDAALKVIARHKVLDLRTEQPSLEEVFRVYYAGEDAAASEEKESNAAS